MLVEEPLDAGHKLVVKLWNASKFAIMRLEDCDPHAPRSLSLIDRWLLSRFARAEARARSCFEECEYHAALEAAESFFWRDLCDNYIEIAKKRLYGDDGYEESGRRGAQHALYQALLGTLKLLAPIMPHVTEEIHSLFFAEREDVESIHVSAWPTPPAEWEDPEALKAGRIALAVIEGMRKVKSVSKVSVAAPVGTLSVACDARTWEMLEPMARELRDVSNAEVIERVSEAGQGFVTTDVEGVSVRADLVQSDDA
jgi:valyl-tRNA synthetase